MPQSASTTQAATGCETAATGGGLAPIPSPPVSVAITPPAVPVFPVRPPDEAEALVRKELADLALPRLRDGLRIAWLPRSGLVADESTKFSVLDASGRPTLFGLLAGDPDPGLLTRAVEASRAAAESLTPALAGAVLQPIAQRSIAGRTCLLYGWHRPISGGLRGRFERWWLSGAVLRWLRGVAACETAPASEARPAFAAALEHLASRPIIAAELRAAAEAALDRLASGRWRPRHQLDHNDMHAGNILFARDRTGEPVRGEGSFRFVVIDWPGANVHGFGIYDLVRCAHSFRLSPRALRREILAHCAALGSEPADAAGHLLAALGQLGMNLGEYSEQRYAAMATRCWAALRATGVDRSTKHAPDAPPDPSEVSVESQPASEF